MKVLIHRILPFLVLIVILSSCSRFPDQAKVIPDTAGAVLTVDIKSLAIKGKLNNVSDFKIFKAIRKEAKSGNKAMAEIIEGFIDNPFSMGIDVTSSIYAFYVQDARDENYIGTSLGMSNSSKFLDNLEAIMDELDVEYGIIEEDAYNFAILDDDVIIGWDSDKLVIVNPINRSTRENLENIIEDLFELKEEKALVAHENFGTFHDQAKDISLWITSNIITENGAAKPFVEQIEYDLEDNYFHAFLDFGASDIDLLVNTFLNEELAQMQKERNIYTTDGDNELVKYCPGNSVMAASISIDTKILEKIISDEPQLDAFREKFKREFGFSLRKAIKAFEGDFVASVYDLQTMEITYMETERIWNPNLYTNYYGTEGGYEYKEVEKTREDKIPLGAFICSMNNSSLLEELIEKMPPSIVTQKGKHYVIDAKGIPVYVGIFDDKLILTTDKKGLDDFDDGTVASDNLSTTEMGQSMMANAIFAFLSLDIDNYPKEFKDKYESTLDESRKMNTMNKIVELYDGISFRVNENSLGINVQLKESDQNSLATILGNADDNYKGLMSL